MRRVDDGYDDAPWSCSVVVMMRELRIVRVRFRRRVVLLMLLHVLLLMSVPVQV